MAALATFEDVATLPGRALTEDDRDGVEALLSQASARFRHEARQQFTPGESTVRLRIMGGSVWLREQPAVEVLAVTTDDDRPVGFQHHGQEVVIGSGSTTLVVGSGGEPQAPIRIDERGGPRIDHVTVRYTHGGTVPDVVKDAVASAVRRKVGIDSDAIAGITQQTDTAGQFSRTRQFAAWAVGGPAVLSPEDIVLARSFRPKTPRVWVMSP